LRPIALQLKTTTLFIPFEFLRKGRVYAARFASGLVYVAAKAFDLFLELKLAALEILKPHIVRHGAAQFVLDSFVERLVTRSQFTDAGFNGHDSYVSSLLDQGE
jgi:hypothetical protein